MVKVGVNAVWLIVSLIQLGQAVYKGVKLSYKNKQLKVGKKTQVVEGVQKPPVKFNETNCHDHLIYGEHIKNKVPLKSKDGVKGAHNEKYFYQSIEDRFIPIYKKEGLTFNINDCIEKAVPHPSFKGIKEIYYKLPALKNGAFLDRGNYVKVKMPKTVYDSAIISDNQMLQWGKEAMQNGIKNGSVVGIKVFGESSNGLKFTGYLDKEGRINNFHPVIQFH